ncbi:MAG: hypothetical protein ACLR23_16015 [Clostridia bacterium]
MRASVGGDVGGDTLDGDEVMVNLGRRVWIEHDSRHAAVRSLLVGEEVRRQSAGREAAGRGGPKWRRALAVRDRIERKKLKLSFEVASVCEGLTSGVEVLEFDVALNLFAIFPELTVETRCEGRAVFNEVAARGVGKGFGEGVNVAGEEKIGIEEDGSDVREDRREDHRQNSFTKKWDIIIAKMG